MEFVQYLINNIPLFGVSIIILFISVRYIKLRKTFYDDVSRHESSINGVIQIDMNGLKYLNDNFGHDAGDIALKEIAKVFEKCIDKKTMIPYRMSGDEFVILMIGGTKEKLDNVVEVIRQKVLETPYSIAIG